jgi:hypothetical protein
MTQEIAKVVWHRINTVRPTGVDLDFDHPMLYPVVGFAEMLLAVHRQREGRNPGLLAVVAEEETLAEVTENINLAGGWMPWRALPASWPPPMSSS